MFPPPFVNTSCCQPLVAVFTSNRSARFAISLRLFVLSESSITGFASSASPRVT